MEIYKLHAQLRDNIDNQRAATNRFYQVLLSGLILFFSPLYSTEAKSFLKKPEMTLLKRVMVVAGALGVFLSWAWGITIDGYLKMKAQKYKVLKELETKLEYQFFTYEAELSGKLAYWKIFGFEIIIPCFICAASGSLIMKAILGMQNKLYFIFLIPMTIVLLHLLITSSLIILQNTRTSNE